MTRVQADKAAQLLSRLGIAHSIDSYRYAAHQSVVVTLHLPSFNPKLNQYASIIKWVEQGCPDLDYRSVENFR